MPLRLFQPQMRGQKRKGVGPGSDRPLHRTLFPLSCRLGAGFTPGNGAAPTEHPPHLAAGGHAEPLVGPRPRARLLCPPTTCCACAPLPPVLVPLWQWWCCAMVGAIPFYCCGLRRRPDAARPGGCIMLPDGIPGHRPVRPLRTPVGPRVQPCTSASLTVPRTGGGIERGGPISSPPPCPSAVLFGGHGCARVRVPWRQQERRGRRGPGTGRVSAKPARDPRRPTEPTTASQEPPFPLGSGGSSPAGAVDALTPAAGGEGGSAGSG